MGTLLTQAEVLTYDGWCFCWVKNHEGVLPLVRFISNGTAFLCCPIEYESRDGQGPLDNIEVGSVQQYSVVVAMAVPLKAPTLKAWSV